MHFWKKANRHTTTHLLDSEGAVHLFKWFIGPVVEILYMERTYLDSTVDKDGIVA